MAVNLITLSLLIFTPVFGLAGTWPEETPIAPDLLKRQWDAVWISCPDRDRTSYGVFHFRKRFNLAARPDKFIIHVSADNRYKLYVNGQEAGDGPARGDLWHWRFETVDIAGYLIPGENLLAAVVWNFAEHVPFAQMTYQTAFLVQGDSELEAEVNTDSSWKVAENRAYSPIPVTTAGMGDFTVVGPADRVDGKKYPWGWEQHGFDHSSWQPAAQVSPATPRGIRWMGSHWHLVPRMIPQMEKKLQPSPILRKASGIKAGENVFRQENKLVVPENSKVTLLLDQTYLTTAHPEITVSGGRDAEISLAYAEALVDDQGNKAHRDRIDGMHVFGYADEFTADGGKNRLFTTLWFRTFRYIQLDVRTAGQPITIDSFRSRFVGYPFKQKASFASGDPALDRIWEVGWRTARLCAGETYFDCPYYEQLNYVGDTRIQALISLYVSGDDRLMRKTIIQFDDSRIPDGLTQSRYPSYMTQVIPPYSLFWIAMVHDYWMHRDDPGFVRSFMPGVRSVIGWFENHLTPSGLLGNMPWWNFVDWASEYQSGVCPGADDGETSVISLQFVYALRYAEELAEKFGQPGEAQYYRALANKVSAAVRKHCWSEKRGLFAETPEKKLFSQHANIMAILVDLIGEDRQQGLFEKIVSEKDLIQCTFYYRFYLMRALKKVGLGDRYLDLLGPWHQMIKTGLTTFAETPEPTRSDCHAWSASPLYEFLATVCGIEPGAPGFRRVRIAPHPGRLEMIAAEFPHPVGNIICGLKKRGAMGISGEIILPEGLYGEFIWHGRKIDLHPGKQQINLTE